VATAINVGANTAPAVGAFDALTRSILGSRNGLAALDREMQRNTATSDRLTQSIGGGMTGAFNRLQSMISTTFSWMTRFAGGIELVFNSILKEADKLQGFNAIMSVTAGSSTKARQEFEFLRKTADQLGLQFDALTSNYAKLVAALPEGNNRLETARTLFLGISMAARTLHASNQDTQLMFYAVTQIASKGVVSMEELRRQLGEKLPGALQIAARALNTTAGELEAAIRKGVVDSAKFLAAFGPELIRTFADPAAIASGSISAAVNRLTNVWVDFVKSILDSGAGQAIINVFDALREKLSDPYAMSQFAGTIEYIATKIADFVKALTKDDIRNGFDTFRRGVEFITTAVTGLVSAFTWIINNAGIVGTIVGALVGGAKGFAAGGAIGSVIPGVGTAAGALVGLGIGAVGGAAGGSYLGNKLSSSPDEVAVRAQLDDAARKAEIEATKQREFIVTQYIKPLLQLYNLNSVDVSQLVQSDRANMETVNVLLSTLQDKRFKNDAERQSAIKMYARTGYLIPEKSTTTLEDVLNGKGKVDKTQARQDETTLLESMGYRGDFLKDWNSLIRLQERGVITADELDKAQDKLLSRQPLFIAYAKQEKDAQEASNAAMNKNIDSAVAFLKVKEDLHLKTQEYTEQVERERYLLTASARQRFVNSGLEDFDREADRARLKANNPYELGILNAQIDADRIKRAQELNQLYSEQTSAITGLTQANQNFFDYFEDRASRVKETFGSFMQGMQSMWEKFITTGKITLTDFVNLIQMELAKVVWNKYIGSAATGLASYLTGALWGFSGGGIMTSQGPLPIKEYAGGGIADTPQVSVWGEGRMPEANVPLPDGRTIPVTIKGKSGGDHITIHQTLYVGSGVTRSEVAAAMVMTKNATISEILNARNRRRSG
jgi:lambda family phage tail tape measure protein